MAFSGYLDELSRTRIAGWAWDSNLPDTPVSLVISVGDRVVARCLADQPRPDVFEAGFGNGRNAFEFFFPHPLSPLVSHEVRVRREGDGEHLVGSPCIISNHSLLDAPTKAAIESLVVSVDSRSLDDAIAFFARQTELLQNAVGESRGDSAEQRQRRGLGRSEAVSSFPVGAAQIVRLPRALVIDDWIPVDGRDAGSDAILSHMQSLQRLGFDVTFVPATLKGDPSALVADGISTCLSPWYNSVEDVLRRQAGQFELVYVHRMSNAARYIGLARQYQQRAKIIYSVADLHFLRSHRQAQVERRPELEVLSDRQRVTEFAAIIQCDVAITHSSHEAEILQAEFPREKIHRVPWSISPSPVSSPFQARRGVAFIANYGHQPNADAARFLLEELMPKIWQNDAGYLCLLAGRGMPQWLRDITREPAEAVGAVPNLSTLFDRVRLSVAPLSFGAGIKGKVLMSLAAGIPCVCTSVAAEGLDLPATLSELIIDDPDDFAAAMTRLERDADFNKICAIAGLEYVQHRLSEHVIDALMRDAVRSW